MKQLYRLLCCFLLLYVAQSCFSGIPLGGVPPRPLISREPIPRPNFLANRTIQIVFFDVRNEKVFHSDIQERIFKYISASYPEADFQLLSDSLFFLPTAGAYHLKIKILRYGYQLGYQLNTTGSGSITEQSTSVDLGKTTAKGILELALYLYNPTGNALGHTRLVGISDRNLLVGAERLEDIAINAFQQAMEGLCLWLDDQLMP